MNQNASDLRSHAALRYRHRVLKTPRLLLRPWRPEDREPFAALNADPRVMRYFPSVLTRAESDALAQRIDDHQRTHGFCFWAVEIPGVAPFIGFVGLAHVNFEAPFAPCVETGWRLAFEHQGHGYATEAARASLQYAFEVLKLPSVVAFTPVSNQPSRHVMEKLGMQHEVAEDFDHPRIPETSPLRRCVLYRVTAAQLRE